MTAKSIEVQIIKKAGDKTVVGKNTYLRQHPVYKKYVKITKKYMIHDESNSVKVGDKVFIRASRPISKRKTWVIINDNSNKE